MRISSREIAFGAAGGFILLALLFFLLLVSPALSRQESLEKSIASKTSDLEEMMILKARWNELERLQGRAENVLTRRGANFTLLSFLEGVTRKVGIQDRIQYMRPLTSQEEAGGMRGAGMEINLEGIGVDQLVRFLYEIEYSGMLLGIKRIRIQTLQRGDEQSLRVTLQVDTVTAI